MLKSVDRDNENSYRLVFDPVRQKIHLTFGGGSVKATGVVAVGIKFRIRGAIGPLFRTVLLLVELLLSLPFNFGVTTDIFGGGWL